MKRDGTHSLHSSLRYALNFFCLMASYHHKKLVVSSFPMIRQIEVSNHCNLSCDFCIREHVKERGLGHMDMETFREIVNPSHARMLRNVSLFMHGEPLLNPYIAKFTKILRSMGKSVNFTTNGMLLSAAKSRELLKSGLSGICISFEGTSKETYEKLRAGACYETVFRNILKFVELRNKGRFRCRISISIIDSTETHEAIPDFKRFWRKHVDNIVILPLHNWLGVLNPDESQTRKKPCFLPWSTIGFYWDGDVAPCCMISRSMGLGNIKKTSIKKVWNSIAYQQFRYNMLYNLETLPCKKCNIIMPDPFENSIESPNPLFPFSPCTLRFTRDLALKLMRKVNI